MLRIGLCIALCACATSDDLDVAGILAGGEGGKADAYGSDVRVEVYQGNESVHDVSRSIATVVNRYQLAAVGDAIHISPRRPGADTLAQFMAASGQPLCPEEKYRDQPLRGRGTAFLITPDTLATAGHVARNGCENLAFIFDFGYWEDPATQLAGLAGITVQPRDNVYLCREARFDRAGRDLAVIKLDRPVVGRTPLRIADSHGPPRPGEKAAMIGSPTGLPLKFAPPGRVIHKSLPVVFGPMDIVIDPSEGFFTNLGAYSGNSGSPVYSTNGLEGVLVLGDEDWTLDYTRGCYVTHVCAEDGSDCYGEYAVRAAHLRSML